MSRFHTSILFFTLMTFASLVGCSSSSKSVQVPQKLRPFEKFSNEFFNELQSLNPSFAVGIGLHQYDDQLTIPDDQYRQRMLDFYAQSKTKLKGFDHSQLNSSELMDYHLMLNYLERAEWSSNTFKSWQWDPSNYNLGEDIALVLESPQKSEKEKALAVSKKMALFPKYYEAALKNISKPTREHLALAIKQNKGTVEYLKSTVQSKSRSLRGDPEKEFQTHLKTAVEATENFVRDLEKLNESASKSKFRSAYRDFRLGQKLYSEKFSFDLQSSFTSEEIYKRALKMRQETHSSMAKIADDLWPKYFPGQKPPKDSMKKMREVIAKVSQNHVKASEFVPTIQKQVPELWDFVVATDLMTLDPKKKLQVRETPTYQRGFAGASVDSPGPYDGDRETYYNVTPLEGMTPEQEESYLREYNNYTLQILNIHEAIPGHYVQLVYASKNPSLAKKIFGNGTMVEGWAVYSELAMMEAGYGNREPELWLMYYKWRLRVITNTILDYGLHNLNLSRDKAIQMMVRDAFQEQEEAEKKWIRAGVSQVQLVSYFAGFVEILDFREELKKKMGDKFNLKQFHEKFLSYGSAPIKYIKEQMRKEML
ncbi:MAG: DUF885 domain-containing protein [Bdellovibrionales bacterium]|nr:DUF885 domain-containing protein [Bdellovibrionales bacterium]